jgi:ribosomal protein S16
MAPNVRTGQEDAKLSRSEFERRWVRRRFVARWWTGLTDMELMSARDGSLDRYIGYYEPYPTSHESLDRDVALQTEVQAAAALVDSVRQLRAGTLARPAKSRDVRPK